MAWPGDHWIRLLKPMTFSGNQVTMEVFTWGQIRTFTFTQRFFAENVLWWIVLGAEPGLL